MESPAAKKLKVEAPPKVQCTPHLAAKPGDFAEICLVPGDPLRAKMIAETYFEDAKLITQVRNMLGYTGLWKGHRVSILGTGMGPASSAIYYQELLQKHGVKKIIRVGSCGTLLSPQIRVGDVVVGIGAGTDSNMNRLKFLQLDSAASPDFGLLEKCVQACRAHPDFAPGSANDGHGKKFHVSKIFTSDYFYHPMERQLYPLLKKFGYGAIEMEAAVLYTIAAEFGGRALTVCTVTDEIRMPEGYETDTTKELSFHAMSSADREKTLKTMVEVALDAAIQAE